MLGPDTGVQHVPRHLFATFARTGSTRAVVPQFGKDGLLSPAWVRAGELKAELAWIISLATGRGRGSAGQDHG